MSVASTLTAAAPATAAVASLALQEGQQKAQLSEADIAQRMNDVALNALQTLMKDNQERMQGYAKDSALLTKGCFYREKYVRALKALNTEEANTRLKWLHKRGCFADGYYSTPKSFDKYATYGLVIKAKVSASKALKKAMEVFSLTDCVNTCRMSIYKALLGLFGEKKFDGLYGRGSAIPFSLAGRACDPVDSLHVPYDVNHLKDIKRGSMIYVGSVPNYSSKHPCGSSQGFRCLCLEEGDNPKFLAFGLDSNGVTYQQIVEHLHQNYNATPDDPKDFMQPEMYQLYLLSEDRKEHLARKDHTLTLEEFQKQMKGLREIAVAFNVPRIAQLYNSSIEEGKALLTGLKASALKFKH